MVTREQLWQLCDAFHATRIEDVVAEYRLTKAAATVLVRATDWVDVEARFRREAAEYVDEQIMDAGIGKALTRLDLIRLSAMRQRLGAVR